MFVALLEDQRRTSRSNSVYDVLADAADGLGRQTQNIASRSIHWSSSWRRCTSTSVLPKDRICNVLYRDLIDDPVGTAEKIFQLPFSSDSRQVLEQYMRCRSDSGNFPMPSAPMKVVDRTEKTSLGC